MHKVKVFFHLVDLPGSQFIAEEIVDKFFESGLIDNADFYLYCNYHQENYDWLRARLKDKPNVKYIYDNALPIEAELPTIIAMKDEVDKMDDDCYILYLHHKGSTKPNDLAVRDWTKYLTYFNVEKWKDCVAKMKEGYDCVGVDWRQAGIDFLYSHYSGNFWWATSKYLKTLKNLKRPISVGFQAQYPVYHKTLGQLHNYKHDAEFWMGQNNPKHYSFHDRGLGIDPYGVRWPEELYRK